MPTLLRSIATSTLCASMVAALAAAPASANAIRTDTGFASHTLAANDDASTGRITLPFPIRFFGVSYHALWINNNGNVTFNGPQSAFTPSLSRLSQPIIAPFFADVDTGGAGSGLVTYGAGVDLVTTNNDPSGTPHQSFGVNWFNVGYFASHTDQLDTFQLVLIDLGNGNFDAEFNYGSMQWETGDANGGRNGLGGTSALVGYGNGAGTSVAYPGSLVNGALINGGPDELRGAMLNDDGLAGRIEFACQSCDIPLTLAATTALAISEVPEPGTLALLGLGLGVIATGGRRRVRRPAAIRALAA